MAPHVLLASVCKRENKPSGESFPKFISLRQELSPHGGLQDLHDLCPGVSGPRVGPSLPPSCRHCSPHWPPVPSGLLNSPEQGPISPRLCRSSSWNVLSFGASPSSRVTLIKGPPTPKKITLLSTRPYFVLIFPPGLSSPGIACNSLPFCVYCQFPQERLRSEGPGYFVRLFLLCSPSPGAKTVSGIYQ